MNVFHRVTLQSLRKNRTRTVVTIIGIALSAAMFCAITSIVTSFMDFGLRNMISCYGDWHGCLLTADSDDEQTLRDSSDVSKLAVAQNIGYAKLENCDNVYKPYLYVMGADKNFLEDMPVKPVSGRQPENCNEIMLPEHLESNGGIHYNLGDKLELEVGDRVWCDTSLWQFDPYVSGEDGGDAETLKVRETKTFTVVGFYSRPEFEPMPGAGYTGVTLPDASVKDYTRNIFFCMEKPGDVYDYINNFECKRDVNRDVLMFKGATGYDSINGVLYNMAAIFIALIVFGSVSLIYNAFSISVAERTKQFGLLTSIGATKRQLRRMVFFEAVSLSVVGIPIGIAAGIGGIGITFLCIGSKFSSLGNNFTIPMRLAVSVPGVLIAIALAFVTVLISAVIPSVRATRVSAIEAIRQTSDVSAKNKKLRVSWIISKLFGLPGILASKHYKRSRKKYRATIVSLFMSIVLFISSSAFMGYLSFTVNGGFASMDYDLMYVAGSGEAKSSEEILSLIRGDVCTTKAVCINSETVNAAIPTDMLESRYIEYDTLRDYDKDSKKVLLQQCFIDDETYRAYLEENGLDAQKYMSAESPLALVYNIRGRFDSNEGRFVSMPVLNDGNIGFNLITRQSIEGYFFTGETNFNEDNELMFGYLPDGSEDESQMLWVKESEAYAETSVKLGEIIDDTPFVVDTSSSRLTLMFPMSAYDTVYKAGNGDDTNDYFLIFSDDHNASYASLKELFKKNGLSYDMLNDYAETVENQRSLILIFNVFSYGFIVLITLIAAANVFNTISTNIALRRREFAMLKTVGMSRKGFTKMMNYECLLYGSKSLLYGLPVSVMITWLMYKSVASGFDVAFSLPWKAVSISVLSVFAVVFTTMLYSMSKVRKDNPIDALKNENL